MDKKADMVVFVPRKRAASIADVWPDIHISKSKSVNSDFHGLQSSRFAIDKSKYNSSLMGSCHKLSWHPFWSRYVFFSSLTLLYFVSQIVTQMSWTVFYTYGFMHQLIWFLFFHYFLFFRIYLPTKITYVNMSFTLPKNSVKSRGVSNVFLGWSCAVVLHAYRTILSKVICHSFSYSWNYHRWLSKLKY